MGHGKRMEVFETDVTTFEVDEELLGMESEFSVGDALTRRV